MYLCYKDFPREFMLFKVVGTTAEAFEKYSGELARQPGVNSSTTHFVRLDGKSRQEIESLMRELGLITSENEREVLLDIGKLGVP
ncbi:MAG: hypothetical protein OK455_10940 [Thaumarchaeota archaeon]|jgi:hypothetical protein|nr:hypothetical protein [Nitrososphaerota archaeon]